MHMAVGHGRPAAARPARLLHGLLAPTSQRTTHAGVRPLQALVPSNGQVPCDGRFTGVSSRPGDPGDPRVWRSFLGSLSAP